jgi:hypothetical protein
MNEEQGGGRPVPDQECGEIRFANFYSFSFFLDNQLAEHADLRCCFFWVLVSFTKLQHRICALIRQHTPACVSIRQHTSVSRPSAPLVFASAFLFFFTSSYSTPVDGNGDASGTSSSSTPAPPSSSAPNTRFKIRASEKKKEKKE